MRDCARPRFEVLEDRCVPATFTVTNLLDDGSTGSLRWAIGQANNNSGEDVINFNSALGSGTITLNGTSLPSLTGPTTILGASNVANRVTISGNNQSPLFAVSTGASVTINGNGLTFANGLGGNGGAIVNAGLLNLVGVLVRDNSATAGGGIYNTGTLSITNSAIVNNQSTGSGISGGGGGIVSSNGATLNLINSTVANNLAASAGGGVLSSGATLVVRNSTVAYNRAGATAFGGGLFLSGGTANVFNTIVAGNLSGSGAGIADDIVGAVATASANNLIGDATTSGGLTQGVNANIVGVPVASVLAPAFANNGGPTPSIALIDGGPAVDAGNNAQALSASGTNLIADQRGTGFPRRLGGIADMGAIEGKLLPQNFVVNTLADVVDPNDGVLSLREAVTAANATNSDDMITFTPSLTVGGPATLVLEGTELTLTFPATVSGPGANLLTVSANRRSRVLTNNSFEGSVTLRGLTLADGLVAGASGGGILNNARLTLDNVVVRDNRSAFGGGIANVISSAALTLINSSVIGNQAFSPSSFVRGGGIGSIGTLNLINTTIALNSIDSPAGGTGGGIEMNILTPSATFRNVTVAYNQIKSGTSSGEGGGMSGDLRLGQLQLFNTLVAGNVFLSGTTSTPSDLGNGVGTVSGSNNLIGDAATSANLTHGVNGNIVGVPVTSVIAPTTGGNGGPTPTVGLVFGSPAIDAGDATQALDASGAALSTDQRGSVFVRLFGGSVDIGASEAQAPRVVALRVLYGNGRSFDVLANPMRILPWQLTGMQAQFSEAVVATQASLLLSGTGVPMLASITGSGSSLVTWTFTSPVVAAQMTASLGAGGAAVTGPGGTLLTPFSQNIRVLFGDVNGDGVVNSTDIAMILAMTRSQIVPVDGLFLDLNGDGIVDIADFNLARSRSGSIVP